MLVIFVQHTSANTINNLSNRFMIILRPTRWQNDRDKPKGEFILWGKYMYVHRRRAKQNVHSILFYINFFKRVFCAFYFSHFLLLFNSKPTSYQCLIVHNFKICNCLIFNLKSFTLSPTCSFKIFLLQLKPTSIRMDFRFDYFF